MEEQKNEIAESIEKAVHDFQMFINPCGYCERYKDMYGKSHETCSHCSYFYPSQFKYNPNNNE
jgi:hypothetical protein